MVDEELAAEGFALYEAQCMTCHDIGTETQATTFVGLTQRRDKEYIMDFIMNNDLSPYEALRAPVGKDDCALRKPGAGLSQSDAKKVFEYMQTI